MASPQRQAAGLCGTCDIESGSCFAELGVFSALRGLARRVFLAPLFDGFAPCACISFIPGQASASGDKRAPVNCPWLSFQQVDLVGAT